MDIDRRRVIARHNPVLTGLSPHSPLSVGNGEFVFTVDVTGLQSFHRQHERATPLCTMAQWGWHSFPQEASLDELHRRLVHEQFDTYGRMVPYETSPRGQEDLFDILRQNPHRLNLATLAFATPDADRIDPQDVADPRQELDLWHGVINSRLSLHGRLLETATACDPHRDAVAFRATSALLRDEGLTVRLAFPYGSPLIHASDWNAVNSHSTRMEELGPGMWLFDRRLDAESYQCIVFGDRRMRLDRVAVHEFVIRGAPGAESLTVVVEFVHRAEDLPSAEGPRETLTFDKVISRSTKHWREFWSTGGFIDLGESTDARAGELERRIVLSRYLTAIQCAGTLPPQETGLTCNSWHGKFHLEMHLFHAAHFALWGKADLLLRSMPWYRRILDRARARAAAQGYAGARWPKMTDPTGRESPSPIGPLLIWQQPHLILFAELLSRARPEADIVEQFAGLVEQTAAFMASYTHREESDAGHEIRYVLGPPVIPAQERHDPRTTINPTFELAYWRTGLRLAQSWRQRAGLSPDAGWQLVLAKLARLPVANGVYLAHERCPETFTRVAEDHPSMLGALGLLPGAGVDRAVMNATLDRVLRCWDMNETWGWDFPLMAMTAARLGRREDAVRLLLLDQAKNTYLINGHNPQLPRTDLPLYLPGNGSLLLAVAMMTAGWDGNTEPLPGFPDDGRWQVRWESVLPLI